MTLLVDHLGRPQWYAKAAICLLVAAVVSAGVLAGLPVKWEIAFVLAAGAASLLLVARGRQRLVLAACAAIVPFSIAKAFWIVDGYVSMNNGVGLELADVLVIILALGVLDRSIRGHGQIRLFPQITVPALAWLAASALSLINAPQLAAGIVQLGVMAKFFVLFLVVANALHDAQDGAALLVGVAFGVIFQGLLGLYQRATGHALGLAQLGEASTVLQQNLNSDLVNRIQGTLGHPNAYCLYLVMALPFFVAVLFSGARRLYKVLAGSVILIGAIGVLLSLSRSGWLGLVLACIIVLGLAVAKKRLELRTAIVAAGVMALAVIMLNLSASGVIGARLTSNDEGSAAIRIPLAETALSIFRRYPVVGAGLNNYGFYIPSYDPGNLDFQGKPIMVHNVYLLVAAETGVLGLAAFVLLLLVLFRRAWCLALRSSSDIEWIVGAGALAALTSAAIQAMSDYDLVGEVKLLKAFWLLAALLAAYAATAAARKPTQTAAMMQDRGQAVGQEGS